MKVILVTDKSKTWGDKVIDFELDDALLEPIYHFLWQLQCKEGVTYAEMSKPEWVTDEDGKKGWRVKPVCGFRVPEYQPTLTEDQWHDKFDRPPWYIQKQWEAMGEK